MTNRIRPLAIIICLLASHRNLPAAEPSVRLEVAYERRLSVEHPQRWLRLLQELPLDSVRMRQARSGDQPTMERGGTAKSPTLRVTGILRPDGQLYLPDARFRISDKSRLLKWIKTASDGETDADSAKSSFGLSEAQLVSLHQSLSVTLRMETRNQPAARVVQQIQSALTIPVSVDGSAVAQLRTSGGVRDELNGLSCGTALAAAVRPLGLAIVPQVTANGSVSLRVLPGRQVAEAWPVGWEPETEARESLPKLFDFLRVEIADTPLDKALNALQTRLGAPMLLDHNGMAAQQISVTGTRVKFPAKRTFYKRVLDHILYQARLEAEIRVDEAQRPFIWVTPQRRQEG